MPNKGSLRTRRVTRSLPNGCCTVTRLLDGSFQSNGSFYSVWKACNNICNCWKRSSSSLVISDRVRFRDIRSTPTELNCRSDPQIMDRKSIEQTIKKKPDLF